MTFWCQHDSIKISFATSLCDLGLDLLLQLALLKMLFLLESVGIVCSKGRDVFDYICRKGQQQLKRNSRDKQLDFIKSMLFGRNSQGY